MTKTLNIGLVGFGRTARLLLREILNNKTRVEVKAIVDAMPTEIMAHLLKFDSEDGRLDLPCKFRDNVLSVGDHDIRLYSAKPLPTVDWPSLKIDAVWLDALTLGDNLQQTIDSTLQAGAPKILILGATHGEDTVFPGITTTSPWKNGKRIAALPSPEIIGAVNILKCVHEQFGIEQGSITHISGVDNTQSLSDVQNRDLRHSRAAGQNIVPMAYDFSSSIASAIPDLKGKLVTMACHVPSSGVSCLDFTLEVRSTPAKEQFITTVSNACTQDDKRIVSTTADEIVSRDVLKQTSSFILDQGSVSLLDDRILHFMGWFDDSASIIQRTLELAQDL